MIPIANPINPFGITNPPTESADGIANSENPITIIPMNADNHLKLAFCGNTHQIAPYLPILWAKGPKTFVPTRYEIEAGRKAAPLSNELAPQDSIIQSGSDGSSMAMPRLPMVIAPEVGTTFGSFGTFVVFLGTFWSYFLIHLIFAHIIENSFLTWHLSLLVL